MVARDLIARHTGIARYVERYGIIGVVIVMMLLLTYLQPEYFLSAQNLTNIAKQIAMNALLAIGMFLVILTAGIDLSVGAIMILASVVMGRTAVVYGVPLLIAFPLGLLVGQKATWRSGRRQLSRWRHRRQGSPPRCHA